MLKVWVRYRKDCDCLDAGARSGAFTIDPHVQEKEVLRNQEMAHALPLCTKCETPWPVASIRAAA